jgi:osmotically-inducible protein OsmY
MRNVLLALTISAGMLCGQQPAADNTKVNQRDRQADTATADKQKMNKSDQETAREIRRAVVTDKALSTYAHNAKIVVRDGTVTLRGPVRSQEEKDSLFQKAAAVAGSSNVVNQLDIAPPKNQASGK